MLERVSNTCENLTNQKIKFYPLMKKLEKSFKTVKKFNPCLSGTPLHSLLSINLKDRMITALIVNRKMFELMSKVKVDVSQ
jgi:hypothetical protein